MLFNFIFNRLKLNRFRKKWRIGNANNLTWAAGFFEIDNVKVGNYSYGSIKIVGTNKYSKLIIGNICSIGGGAQFIMEAEHKANYISTYPFEQRLYNNYEKNECVSKGNIIIDDDVWIGQNAIVMSGVHIGQGAVVGAGAVVTKDVPPYAIVCGVPAKVIKYRFNQNIIDELLKVDFSKLGQDVISKHMADLHVPLESIDQLKWLPKK